MLDKYQLYMIYADTMDSKRASSIRQEITQLQAKRDRLEELLIKRRRMLRASFITRYLGTSKEKRKTPAYYLSYNEGGKTVLKYVALGKKQKVEALAEAWREYSQSLAEWVKTCRQLERAYSGASRSLIPDEADH